MYSWSSGDPEPLAQREEGWCSGLEEGEGGGSRGGKSQNLGWQQKGNSGDVRVESRRERRRRKMVGPGRSGMMWTKLLQGAAGILNGCLLLDPFTATKGRQGVCGGL